MTVGLFDSAIYGPLFSDGTLNALFSDTQRVRSMIEVEAALARVQGRLAIIPRDAADVISQVAVNLDPDLAALGEGTEAAGVPVIALVAQLRRAAGEEASPYVHWGTTSQDVVDTALVLQLRLALDRFDAGLEELISRLAGLAETHRNTLMVARTRSQQALPTTFGLKVAGWLTPCIRHRARLAELRQRLLVVQFGGAAGTLAALGDDGMSVLRGLADELGLSEPPGPWHTQRDTVAELAGWLSLLTGSLGKMGQDLLLLAQTEVGEVTEGGNGARGGSSAMPHKSNPIASELLVSAARLNASLLVTVHQALVHEHERSGSAWQLEWAVLPQMVACAGGALKHALQLADNMTVHVDRMRANLDASHGLVMAETAALRLGEHMPLPEAQALVKQACAEAVESGQHLADVLRAKVDAPVDWERLKDPGSYLGSSNALIDRATQAAECRRG